MKDYTRFCRSELETELTNRRLDPSGLKPVLLARLLLADLNAVIPMRVCG